jgi:hypothetical protein
LAKLDRDAKVAGQQWPSSGDLQAAADQLVADRAAAQAKYGLAEILAGSEIRGQLIDQRLDFANTLAALDHSAQLDLAGVNKDFWHDVADVRRDWSLELAGLSTAYDAGRANSWSTAQAGVATQFASVWADEQQAVAASAATRATTQGALQLTRSTAEADADRVRDIADANSLHTLDVTQANLGANYLQQLAETTHGANLSRLQLDISAASTGTYQPWAPPAAEPSAPINANQITTQGLVVPPGSATHAEYFNGATASMFGFYPTGYPSLGGGYQSVTVEASHMPSRASIIAGTTSTASPGVSPTDGLLEELDAILAENASRPPKESPLGITSSTLGAMSQLQFDRELDFYLYENDPNRTWSDEEIREKGLTIPGDDPVQRTRVEKKIYGDLKMLPNEAVFAAAWYEASFFLGRFFGTAVRPESESVGIERTRNIADTIGAISQFAYGIGKIAQSIKPARQSVAVREHTTQIDTGTFPDTPGIGGVLDTGTFPKIPNTGGVIDVTPPMAPMPAITGKIAFAKEPVPFRLLPPSSVRVGPQGDVGWRNAANAADELADAPFAPGSLGAAKAWTITGRINAAELPTSGRIRFVPPQNYSPSQPLPRGPQNGYIDRFGNEWVRGPSRTVGEAFEWDVQLSHTGRKQIGWLSRDGMHVNVSLRGHVTH